MYKVHYQQIQVSTLCVWLLSEFTVTDASVNLLNSDFGVLEGEEKRKRNYFRFRCLFRILNIQLDTNQLDAKEI